MNVPFTLADDRLDAVFLQEAEDAWLLNLRVIVRSAGCVRLYNAVEEASVDALCDFMQDFEQRLVGNPARIPHAVNNSGRFASALTPSTVSCSS